MAPRTTRCNGVRFSPGDSRLAHAHVSQWGEEKLTPNSEKKKIKAQKKKKMGFYPQSTESHRQSSPKGDSSAK
jgi:hypothetical protein